ncbi:hypothetical protein GPECTOR_15g388 [Gonium pectorale]|uniref:Major facilitator superfamily (MFS) profile domain-containing protein n=1 Tax=Gonium pectorale TaxID=33097 RepID=A0A150GLL9_GONPE|nr:hypothetical protein GPECTOR_15g388 [Gonium pectorale]|eukprot:KXZ50704.1 hypothetical protein GPECTOR_15g388 [Gonium pectorale]
MLDGFGLSLVGEAAARAAEDELLQLWARQQPDRGAELEARRQLWRSRQQQAGGRLGRLGFWSVGPSPGRPRRPLLEPIPEESSPSRRSSASLRSMPSNGTGLASGGGSGPLELEPRGGGDGRSGESESLLQQGRGDANGLENGPAVSREGASAPYAAAAAGSGLGVVGGGPLGLPGDEGDERERLLSAQLDDVEELGAQEEAVARGASSAAASTSGAGQAPSSGALGDDRSFLAALVSLLGEVRDLARGPERRALWLALGLAFFDQAAASTAIINYAPSLLSRLARGMAGDDGGAMLYTVAIGGAKAVGVVTALLTVDRFGRRPLLIAGALASAAALAAVSVAAAGGSAPLLAGSMCIFTFCFSVSWAGLYWVVVSELFSMSAKSAGTSAATGLLFLTGAVTNFVFLSLEDAMGAAVFLLFAAICLASAAYVWALLPETKGRTLAEVESMLTQAGACGASGRGQELGAVPLSGSGSGIGGSGGSSSGGGGAEGWLAPSGPADAGVVVAGTAMGMGGAQGRADGREPDQPASGVSAAYQSWIQLRDAGRRSLSQRYVLQPNLSVSSLNSLGGSLSQADLASLTTGAPFDREGSMTSGPPSAMGSTAPSPPQSSGTLALPGSWGASGPPSGNGTGALSPSSFLVPTPPQRTPSGQLGSFFVPKPLPAQEQQPGDGSEEREAISSSANGLGEEPAGAPATAAGGERDGGDGGCGDEAAAGSSSFEASANGNGHHNGSHAAAMACGGANPDGASAADANAASTGSPRSAFAGVDPAGWDDPSPATPGSSLPGYVDVGEEGGRDGAAPLPPPPVGEELAAYGHSRSLSLADGLDSQRPPGSPGGGPAGGRLQAAVRAREVRRLDSSANASDGGAAISLHEGMGFAPAAYPEVTVEDVCEGGDGGEGDLGLGVEYDDRDELAGEHPAAAPTAMSMVPDLSPHPNGSVSEAPAAAAEAAEATAVDSASSSYYSQYYYQQYAYLYQYALGQGYSEGDAVTYAQYYAAQYAAQYESAAPQGQLGGDQAPAAEGGDQAAAVSAVGGVTSAAEGPALAAGAAEAPHHAGPGETYVADVTVAGWEPQPQAQAQHEELPAWQAVAQEAAAGPFDAFIVSEELGTCGSGGDSRGHSSVHLAVCAGTQGFGELVQRHSGGGGPNAALDARPAVAFQPAPLPHDLTAAAVAAAQQHQHHQSAVTAAVTAAAAAVTAADDSHLQPVGAAVGRAEVAGTGFASPRATSGPSGAPVAPHLLLGLGSAGAKRLTQLSSAASAAVASLGATVAASALSAASGDRGSFLLEAGLSEDDFERIMHPESGAAARAEAEAQLAAVTADRDGLVVALASERAEKESLAAALAAARSESEELRSRYASRFEALSSELEVTRGSLAELQSEHDELLLCLGQESTKVSVLVEALRDMGGDPDPMIERIEAEYETMGAGEAEDGEDQGEDEAGDAQAEEGEAAPAGEGWEGEEAPEGEARDGEAKVQDVEQEEGGQGGEEEQVQEQSAQQDGAGLADLEVDGAGEGWGGAELDLELEAAGV